MAKKVYTFDEATHTHRINGQPVPGITTAIKPLADYDTIPENVLRAAAEWGTNVHKAVELFCSDSLDLDSLGDPLRQTVGQFEAWLQEQRLDRRDFVVELPMGDASLMYGGIPDLILDGKLVVEIKTRPVNVLTDSIQTAAQEKLWIKNGGTRVWSYERRVLFLAPDRHEYTQVNRRDDWGRFRLLLDHYHNAQKIKLWKENK